MLNFLTLPNKDNEKEKGNQQTANQKLSSNSIIISQMKGHISTKSVRTQSHILKISFMLKTLKICPSLSLSSMHKYTFAMDCIWEPQQ